MSSASSFNSWEYYSSDEETNLIQSFLETQTAYFSNLITQHPTPVEEQGSTSRSRRRRGPDQVRDRESAHDKLYADYFATECNYNDGTFKRRFRVSRRLFLRIVEDLEERYEYFQQKPDARGRLGLSPLQKCTSAIRQMAYGITSDGLDDYLKMGESTARECLNKFTLGIIKIYGKRYLRKPNYDDIRQLYEAHEARHGFLGMLGSIDCMHWEWGNCPNGWRGQYVRGGHGCPTIILEAVASQDLWVWHAFFGVSGSNNDINVLEESPLFNTIYNGKAPQCPFEVNGVQYKHRYYLSDGIYVEWATFVKSFTCPIYSKRIRFKGAQEAARKDVGTLLWCAEKTLEYNTKPGKTLVSEKIRRVMYACLILHNMILEDEGKAICHFNETANEDDEDEDDISREQYTTNVREVRNKETHHNLRADLIEHISRLPRDNQ